MSAKSKGTRAERELFHKFYNTKKWIPIRVAGSGSTPIPAPDILVGNGKRHLAIECKVVRKTIKYIDKGEINQLNKFSMLFGAEPWVAVKFDRIGWFFLKPKDIKKTSSSYVVSLELAKKKGLSFEKISKS